MKPQSFLYVKNMTISCYAQAKQNGQRRGRFPLNLIAWQILNEDLILQAVGMRHYVEIL